MKLSCAYSHAAVASRRSVTVAFIISAFIVGGCGEITENPMSSPPDAQPGGTDSMTALGCGDGQVDVDEECDDGNSAAGDGCSATCSFEQQCFVTLNGGSPAVTSSIRVSRTGGLSVVDSITLPGNHSPNTWPARLEGAASCGRHIFYTLASSDLLARVEAGEDGSLNEQPEVLAIPGIFGLYCDDDYDLLFVAANSEALRVEVGVYRVAADGGLTRLGEQLFSFFGGDNLDHLSISPHPATKQLLLTAGVGNFSGLPHLDFYRIDYDSEGALTTAEGPLTLVDDYSQGVRYNFDGSVVAVVAYSGSGLGYGATDGDGNLPTPSEVTYTGNIVPSNGYDMLFQARSNIFYYSGLVMSVGKIGIGEFVDGQPVSIDEVDTSNTNTHLHFAYGGKVLLSGGRSTGEVNGFQVSDSQANLTHADSVVLSSFDEFMGATTIPCPQAQ